MYKAVQSFIIISKNGHLNAQQLKYDPTVRQKNILPTLKINHLARGGRSTRWEEQNKGFSYPGKERQSDYF